MVAENKDQKIQNIMPSATKTKCKVYFGSATEILFPPLSPV